VEAADLRRCGARERIAVCSVVDFLAFLVGLEEEDRSGSSSKESRVVVEEVGTPKRPWRVAPKEVGEVALRLRSGRWERSVEC